MELSIEDRAVLAHVVVSVDDWVAHALNTVGEEAVTAKIARWKPEYLAVKDLPGYKTRVERETEERK
jgi:hypothetical protein